MSYIKFNGLIVLVVFYFPLYESCLTSNVRQCEDYGLLSGVEFHGFISADFLDFYCRRLQEALACAYTKGELKRCPLLKRLPFDTQQGVVDIVCNYRKGEYLKSSQCFSNHEVKRHITTTCLPAMTASKVVSKDRCGTLTWVLECARTKVLMTDGCDSVDSELMVDLLQIFLQPKSIMSYCPNLGSKAGEIKPNNVGDKSSPENAHRLSVANSTSQQPLLIEDQKIKTSFEETDGKDSQTAEHESQRIGDGTTRKYLDDATLPAQSASRTNNVDSHEDERSHPEMTQNQDPTQQSQESMITLSSGADLRPEDEMEPPAMKSTREDSAKSEITSMEHTTIGIGIRSSTTADPGSQGVYGTVAGSTNSTTVELESENVKQKQQQADRSISDSHMTSQAKTLKSTQGSGNDGTVLCFTQLQLAMALTTIILLVLYGN